MACIIAKTLEAWLSKQDQQEDKIKGQFFKHLRKRCKIVDSALETLLLSLL